MLKNLLGKCSLNRFNPTDAVISAPKTTKLSYFLPASKTPSPKPNLPAFILIFYEFKKNI
jgi:hypothetical protein